MTRLPPSGSRLGIGLHDISEEDCKTYKAWIHGCCIGYVLLIAGLLTVGIFTPHSDMQTATGGQTAGIGLVAKPAGHHAGG